MSYPQPISTAHIRRQTTIMAWVQVYSAVVRTEHEKGLLGEGTYRHNHAVACQVADMAIEALEERFPQALALSNPKTDKSR